MKCSKHKLVTALAVTSALALSGCGSDNELRAPTDQPNVVVVYLDDAGYGDVSAFNDLAPQTPNLDEMAAQGQRWTNFYVAESICTPSRASLLTARVSMRNGMYGPIGGALSPSDTTGLPAQEYTLAESLKEAGYHTAMLGKWHLGNKEAFYPTRHGFDQFYGNLVSNDYHELLNEFRTVEFGQAMMGYQQLLTPMMQVLQDPEASFQDKQDAVNAVTPSAAQYANDNLLPLFAHRQTLTVNPLQEYWNVPVLTSYSNDQGEYVDGLSIMEQKSFTKNLTERAKSYISEQKNNPFFLYLAYPQNHVPLFVADEHQGKTNSTYGDVMQEIDASVGEVINHIKAMGLDENTIVIFASDNGPWLEQIYVAAGHAGSTALGNGKGNLLGAKQTSADGGVKSPTIIRWPGQIAPAVIDGIGSNLDIFPTIAALTGAKLPSQHNASINIDGLDLSATLLNGDDSVRTSMPYYFKGQLHGWRSGDYKVQLMNPGMGLLPGIPDLTWTPKLYDLANDPNELIDLSSGTTDLGNGETGQQILARLMGEAQAYHATVAPDIQAPLMF